MRLTLAAALFALLPAGGTAADAVPAETPAESAAVGRFEWAGTPESLLIGSSFTLRGLIEFPEEHELQGLDREGLDTGAFELLGTEIGEREFQDGLERRPVTVVVAAFALGNQTLPPLRWALRAPQAAAPAVTSPAVTVTVTPPAPGLRDTGDIRDIKGPYSPRLWPWVLALLAALGAAAWGGSALWRRARRPAGESAVPAAAPDLRSYEEIALAEIDALLRMGLPVKEYYDRISDILRLYFERRYGISALSMTTYDLHRRLLQLQADPQARSWIKALFTRCDLAKFARLLPGEEETREDAESARRIVRQLAPQAAPPAEELVAKR
ncbi:MAG: hypothetical protein A2X36_05835 [Elusimicrobia bacterium GWA2_69_24]|nr:MAG: hypothetical protein A2X36_05835 [Elusimicrobia bacterium GWA2_69_24]